MTAMEHLPPTRTPSIVTAPPPPATDGEVPGVEPAGSPELAAPRTNGVNGDASTPDADILHAVEDAFKLSSQYGYTPRKLKVFTIGAGFSGLLMAHKIQHRFPEMDNIVDHTIFEALPEVGGTWFVNNYPGVQCDVPAHIYVSFGNFRFVIALKQSINGYRHSHSTLTRTGSASTQAVPISSHTSRPPSGSGI